MRSVGQHHSRNADVRVGCFAPTKKINGRVAYKRVADLNDTDARSRNQAGAVSAAKWFDGKWRTMLLCFNKPYHAWVLGWVWVWRCGVGVSLAHARIGA